MCNNILLGGFFFFFYVLGFALGSTIESKTKGIWMWCVPHPSKQGHTLVLLDTEGLGDVHKVWTMYKVPKTSPVTKLCMNLGLKGFTLMPFASAFTQNE